MKNTIIMKKHTDRIRKEMDEIFEGVREMFIEQKYESYSRNSHHAIFTVKSEETGKNEFKEVYSFWISNEDYGFKIDDFEDDLPQFTEEQKKELWDIYCDIENSSRLKMTYKEFITNKDSDKVQKELELRSEIQKAREILKENNETL